MQAPRLTDSYRRVRTKENSAKSDGHGETRPCPSEQLPVIVAEFFPAANGAVDRLRAEMPTRGRPEHQRNVRKLNQGSARDADRELRQLTLRCKWRVASISRDAGPSGEHKTSRSGRFVARTGAATGYCARVPGNLGVLHRHMVSMRASACRRVGIGRRIWIEQKPVVGVFHG